MFQKDCPCYTCLVASMCPGKEPTEEEWDEVSRQVDKDDRNGVNSWSYEDIEDLWDIPEIPELEAQEKCPYYIKWQNKMFKKNNLTELDQFIGIDNMENIKNE